MNNVPAFFRPLVVYGTCVILAIWLGYLLASPLTYSSLAIYVFLAAALTFPLLLRWHFPLLLLSWNMAAFVFFLPGQPSLCLVMIALSLGISVFQRMLSKESQFIHVPQLVLPLLCLIAVAVVTAKLTGLGLRTFGSDVYGGKKYVYLLGGILGYFALSARRIPLDRKNLYIALFFLGGVSATIGDLLVFLPHSMYFVYWFFQPNEYFFTTGGPNAETMRFGGAWATSFAIFSYMLAGMESGEFFFPANRCAGSRLFSSRFMDFSEVSAPLSFFLYWFLHCSFFLKVCIGQSCCRSSCLPES